MRHGRRPSQSHSSSLSLSLCSPRAYLSHGRSPISSPSVALLSAASPLSAACSATRALLSAALSPLSLLLRLFVSVCCLPPSSLPPSLDCLFPPRRGTRCPATHIGGMEQRHIRIRLMISPPTAAESPALRVAGVLRAFSAASPPHPCCRLSSYRTRSLGALHYCTFDRLE